MEIIEEMKKFFTFSELFVPNRKIILCELQGVGDSAEGAGAGSTHAAKITIFSLKKCSKCFIFHAKCCEVLTALRMK
jgi:hypothetical protein